MKKNKTRLVLKKSVKNFISRLMITIILLLALLIVIKQDPKFKDVIRKNVFSESLEFTKAKKVYQKYFGKFLSVDNIVKEDTPVFSEKLQYSKSNKYKDGVMLTVTSNYMIPILESGIVVFIGEKEGYGNTVIIEGIDGVAVWYSNIKSVKVNMYDYVEKGSLLGEVNNKKLYLVFQKEDKYLDYKKYI